jgi:hypothetical protein
MNFHRTTDKILTYEAKNLDHKLVCVIVNVLSKDMRALYYLAAHTWKQKSHVVCTKSVGEVAVYSNNNDDDDDNCYYNYYSILVY